MKKSLAETCTEGQPTFPSPSFRVVYGLVCGMQVSSACSGKMGSRAEAGSTGPCGFNAYKASPGSFPHSCCTIATGEERGAVWKASGSCLPHTRSPAITPALPVIRPPAYLVGNRIHWGPASVSLPQTLLAWAWLKLPALAWFLLLLPTTPGAGPTPRPSVIGRGRYYSPHWSGFIFFSVQTAFLWKEILDGFIFKSFF